MKELIVITGSSGRVGRCLYERLHTQYEVVGLDFVPPKERDNFIALDLTSDESVRNAFAEIQHRFGRKVASFIHLAAHYSFSDLAWENYEKITLRGTERLLNALSAFDVEQFLFSSTLLVHAPSAEKISEDSPLAPRWAYPKSKILTEKLIQENPLPSLILRIAGCYDDQCHSIPLANMIQRTYEKRLTSRFFPGDLSHGAPYLHFADLAEAVSLAVSRRKQLPPGTTLLLGEEITYSYETLQKRLWQLLYGKERKTYPIPKVLAKIGAWIQGFLPFSKEKFIKPWMVDFADDHYDLDISKAKRLLGWQPKHSLYETIPLMIKALKADPASWGRENGLK